MTKYGSGMVMESEEGGVYPARGQADYMLAEPQLGFQSENNYSQQNPAFIAISNSPGFMGEVPPEVRAHQEMTRLNSEGGRFVSMPIGQDGQPDPRLLATFMHN